MTGQNIIEINLHGRVNKNLKEIRSIYIGDPTTLNLYSLNANKYAIPLTAVIESDKIGTVKIQMTNGDMRIEGNREESTLKRGFEALLALARKQELTREIMFESKLNAELNHLRQEGYKAYDNATKCQL